MTWFKTWFNTPYYHILYSDRNYEEAEHFISLLTKDLALPKGNKIIDLACGKGRHSIYLNKLGYKVLGVDLSEESITHNKKFENETLKFRVHDIRDELSEKNRDAVFSLFTSFGYFDDIADDKKVFHSVYNALSKGGYFVLDFLNQQYVKNTLVEDAVIEKQGIKFNISKRIENGYVIKDIRFNDHGENHHYYEKVKLHTLESIEDIAKKQGFRRIKIHGNYHLNDFQLEKSPRCINVFIKE